MEAIEEFKKLSGDIKIGFIGNGNMCKSILKGIFKSKLFNAKEILVSGRENIVNDEKIRELGVHLTQDNKKVINTCKIVFLCTKPNSLDELSEQLKNLKSSVDYGDDGVGDNTLVSILAGTSISKLRDSLPFFGSFIRAMPNTPLQVGEGKFPCLVVFRHF